MFNAAKRVAVRKIAAYLAIAFALAYSLGFGLQSLVTGFFWGLWHLPLITHGYNYPGHVIAGPVMMTLLTILLAPILAFLRLRAHSVFAPAVFRGTFNAAATLAILLRGSNPMLTGATGISGMLVLLVADAFIWFSLRHPQRTHQLCLGG